MNLNQYQNKRSAVKYDRFIILSKKYPTFKQTAERINSLTNYSHVEYGQIYMIAPENSNLYVYPIWNVLLGLSSIQIKKVVEIYPDFLSELSKMAGTVKENVTLKLESQNSR